ncbi:MAG: isoprenylcysteine carboxylmethyltransferase family protein [Xanthomonadales bacterium]|nr:isoprenylcysteine carboxylmethyltransferase family protein [Xanthomonadales bacterium]
MNVEQIVSLRPPRIAQLLTLAATVIHFTTPLREFVVFSSTPLGVTVALSGLAAMLWAWDLFRRCDTVICPTATATSLVTSGIFHVTRNPMYLGIVSMLLGLALAVGTLPFYIAAASYFTLIDRIYIPYEERRLTKIFGAAYRDYRERVRRWL